MTTRTGAFLGCAALATMTSLAVAVDVNYTCSDGTHLRAEFSPPSTELGHVVLVIGSKEKVTLPQVKSADGGRYANADMEFWIRGKEATLTRGGRSEKCHTT
jgi:membrane-bound inhibitor of C-type lysozyme